MGAELRQVMVSGFFLASLFAAPVALVAQEGQVFARIVDQSGDPVEGVEVSVGRCLSDPSTKFPTPGPRTCVSFERVTNADGEATFPSVSIGSVRQWHEYLIVTSKEGYTEARDVVTLRPARNEFELTIYQLRGNPIAVLFQDAQDTAGRGDIEGAEEMMAEATAQMADNINALFGSAVPDDIYVRGLTLLADYRMQLGRFDGAEEALFRATVLVPGDPFVLRTLTILAATRQDWIQAEQRASDYLAARPDDPDALMLFGMVQLETGRIQEAIEYLRQAADINPEWPPIHRMLGTAYEGSGRPQDAIKHYELYLELAGTPADRGDIEAAISRLRR